MNIIRHAILLLIAVFPLAATCAPQQRTQTKTPQASPLAQTNYDVAEAIFRYYLDQYGASNPAKTIFFLSYGFPDAGLPSDFFARLKSYPSIKRASKSEILKTVEQGKGIFIAIRTLKFQGDSATADVLTVSGGITFITSIVRLRKGEEMWQVNGKEDVGIACFGRLIPGKAQSPKGASRN